MTNLPRSLYRRALKLSLDWTVLRHRWRGQAVYIRSLFDAQKDVKDFRLQRVDLAFLQLGNLVDHQRTL